ncbi:Hsp20/alpha crystallin family protein [Neobacillus sedimentimangrovi]|uniref:Hsp20/alpha crystallin family protein n=1 Tax=Neobacillus sedimentimangrovi TaxID=2699460 RepID=A0ABS8QFT3_9BACI|nr:Hsp20/alpha crystallin family protein [Neobacillus sedimentimangrovi]MCD4837640.1 Hsp20/alpha crystallin family protein [Neobacillus sedimentimangrovi]
MKKKKLLHSHSIDFDLIDQWLKNYFLDPKTLHEDHTQFKIDIYETNTDWIIAAFLEEFASSEITVKVEDTSLKITAQKHSYKLPSPFPKHFRSIDFPFSIINHDVKAFFENGTLEIFISKSNIGHGQNRFITLP